LLLNEVDDAVVRKEEDGVVVVVVVRVKAQQEEQYLLLMPAAAASTAHHEKNCPACLIAISRRFVVAVACNQAGSKGNPKTSSKGFERLCPFSSSCFVEEPCRAVFLAEGPFVIGSASCLPDDASSTCFLGTQSESPGSKT
jgi:hypothetical protein